MFVRKDTIKGRTYYRVVESYRPRVRRADGGAKAGEKGKQRTLANLGTHPTIEAAWREAGEEYFATCERAGKGKRKLGSRAKWDRFITLNGLLRKEKGKAFVPDPRIEPEAGRWYWVDNKA